MNALLFLKNGAIVFYHLTQPLIPPYPSGLKAFEDELGKGGEGKDVRIV